MYIDSVFSSLAAGHAQIPYWVTPSEKTNTGVLLGWNAKPERASIKGAAHQKGLGMSRCLEASETRGGNSYKRSIMVIRGKEKKVKNAGKVPLGRANDARFHQGPTEESQASKARFLLFTFPRFSSIAIAFLSDIRAGFVLLCTNVADAISAETRDRQNNKSRICSSSRWKARPASWEL